MKDSGGEPSPSESRSFKRQLNLFDLVLAQILCVVGSNWVGVAAGLGRAQAVTWIIAILIFYLPMAASVFLLNREIPLEGGLYVWARAAFGDFAGFMTAWNIWVYGVAVTASILYAVPTELMYLLGPSGHWIGANHFAYLALVMLAITGVTLAALRGLEVAKWIHNLGGFAMLVVFAALVTLPFWKVSRHFSSVELLAPLAMVPPPLNAHSLALMGQMLFGALCGLEYVAIMAGESKRPAHSIGQSVLIASPIICGMFILGTSTVVLFVTRTKIDLIAPIPQTLRMALGSAGVGSLFAAVAITLLQVRFLGIASYMFTGVTRLPMVAGWGRVVPTRFTRLNRRWQTPANAIMFTAILITLIVSLASFGVHAQESFQTLVNVSLTHYEIAYLFMFAIPLWGTKTLRTSFPA